MKDYCDGTAYREHELFQNSEHALQIQMYYDDIDVCNPIGSKSTIHKLGIFVSWDGVGLNVTKCV